MYSETSKLLAKATRLLKQMEKEDKLFENYCNALIDGYRGDFDSWKILRKNKHSLKTK